MSTWCDILCRELSEVEFTLYAVTGQPEVTYKYDPPPNARGLVHLPLWGAADPVEHLLATAPFREIYRRKRATTARVIEAEFIPLFATLLDGMYGRQADLDVHSHGAVLHSLWRYFQAYDWKTTWRAQAAWALFCAETLRPLRESPEAYLPNEVPSVYDLTTAMRWLYAFLLPLAAPIPPTDIVHTTIAAFAGLPGILAKHERGTPFLVTDHGVWIRERYIAVSQDEFSVFGKQFLMNLGSYVSRLIYGHADVVSPVTNFNRRWEVPYGTPPERIETINNGVDPAVFVPGPKPARTAGRPVVIAAARLFPLKDIETMIRAAAVVRERIGDVAFLLYGDTEADPPYTRRCRALVAELGLEGTFEFAGHHPNPAEVYLEGDLTVLSSISEAFPYTVLESMSCGRPVVGTDVGGVKEALQGFGIVVPPRNPRALGEGIVRLLEDDHMRFELGRRARSEVLAKYRISGTIDAYRDLYGRLLEGSPAEPEATELVGSAA